LVDKVCRIAKKRKMQIAIDLSSYNVVDSNLAAFRETVEKYVDIVFANEEEARSFTGMEPEDALNAISQLCEVAIIKVGSEGSWIQWGDKIIKVGPHPVNCKDTTGAGDLYASGFLYGYSNNYNLEKCGLLGSLTAGKVIEIVGARMNEERWDDIKKSIVKFSNT
jgi:sugar/nucleoside kinase (ribokinase family)